jgi:hypothetical protein
VANAVAGERKAFWTSGALRPAEGENAPEPLARPAARRRLRWLVLPALGALLIAGCSGGGGSSDDASPSPAAKTTAPPVDPAATALMTTSQKAFRAVKSVHMQGNLVTGGEQILLDMSVTNSAGGQGLIVTAGQPIQIVRQGNTVWVRGNETFYTRICGSGAAAKLNGKWLKGAAGGFDKSLVDLTSVSGLSGLLTPTSTVRKTGTATIKGVRVTQLTIPSTNAEVLSIAATGRPLPVQLTRTANTKERGILTFTDYDKAVPIYTPPADQTIAGCPASASPGPTASVVP